MPISLRTPDDRDRLDARDKPWFVRISDALHLGYKKGKSVSRWIVRFRTSTGYISRTMSGVVPDDHLPPNNQTIVSYEQALVRAMNMNIENLDDQNLKQCGLCGRSQTQVAVLVAGVSTFICDACINKSCKLLDSYDDIPDEAVGPGTVEVLLSPGIDFNIDRELLLELFTRTSFAMANEDKRNFLRGVLLEFDRGQLRAVATNSHYLAIGRADVTTNVKALQHIIVARDDVPILTGWLQSVVSQSLNVTVQDNVLCLSSGDADVRASLVFGSYPNYQEVVPKYSQSFTVNRSSLLASLDLASNSTEAGTLKASLSKGTLTLSAASTAESKFTVDYEGDPITTGLDCVYLGNILRAIRGDSVRIAVKSREHPWRFESEQGQSTTYVLMPINVW